MKTSINKTDMDALVSLCKRKGFIFASSEIYGGFNGFFDYGPLGTEMKKNIKDCWWQDMVQKREDIVGLDTSIISHPAIWKASGHVDAFSDPMVDCKVSKMRYRADQLFYGTVKIESDDTIYGYVCVVESPTMHEEALSQAKQIRKARGKTDPLQQIKLIAYTEASPDLYSKIPSPATKEPGSLTAPRAFNLMFHTRVGALTEGASTTYLRPETAQGIFVNFKHVLDSTRVKIPFGIAQIGKAFRNEITPRNFIFRSREFEQMEIEYFISPNETIWKNIYQNWIQTRLEWHKSIGINPNLLSLETHPQDKLAHYARAGTDIVFSFPFGVSELEGIAARGNYDLTQHQQASGKSLEYFDEETKETYIPHVIEPSLGVDRVFLALLCSAYSEELIDGEKRSVLRLHPRIAPVKIAILPLVKNKPEIVKFANIIYKKLQKHWNVSIDLTGAIGRRYRRMDEIGTPFCITVDYESLEDQAVTVRYRDSMIQERIQEDQLFSFFFKHINEL